jgi:hypothetical protein
LLDGDQRITEAIRSGELGDLKVQAPLEPEPHQSIPLEVAS